VACISDLIVKEGLINLDFADVLSVMKEKGKAMMGRGEATGEKRVLAAAVAAISNPLIENPSIKRASGLIISITGGRDLMLFEVDEAATRIRDEADPDANIIVGASFDDSLEGIVRVSVVATGIDNLDPAQQTQRVESALTQLAGRLRNDGRRIADRIERSAPLPQVESPPLRPEARQPTGQPARPHPDHARQAARQPHDPYGRASPRNATDEDMLDIPAFLRRTGN
jgi:cell division protein FtsZ